MEGIDEIGASHDLAVDFQPSFEFWLIATFDWLAINYIIKQCKCIYNAFEVKTGTIAKFLADWRRLTYWLWILSLHARSRVRILAFPITNQIVLKIGTFQQAMK